MHGCIAHTHTYEQCTHAHKQQILMHTWVSLCMHVSNVILMSASLMCMSVSIMCMSVLLMCVSDLAHVMFFGALLSV